MVKFISGIKGIVSSFMCLAKLLTNKALTVEQAQAAATRMAREVLANPVIEDYRVEIVEA